MDVTPAVVNTSVNNGAAYTGTVLVQNPEKYIRKEEDEKNENNQQ
jgi:hypothetical protein